jgi:Tfp pilus assembly protein PilX
MQLEGYGGKFMRKTKAQRGFTLIAALLLTILLSGIAVGLLYTVSNESRMGGNELEGNLAYYGAEAEMENLTAQLSTLYQTSQTPTAATITALGATPSNWATAVSGSNITSLNYNPPPAITWPNSDSSGNPVGTWDIVGAGQDQGMVATLIPFNLSVTAVRQAGSGQTAAYSTLAASGAAANLNRTVEVALLPAFEFGVFCDGDCDYFAGPNFNFGGRVHTNGNLFLTSGGNNLTFTDKIAAVGQVIMDQLENGWPTSNQYGGQVWVPSAGNGCPAAPATGPGTSGNCPQLTAGSWTGGFPPTGAANSGWKTISTGTFNSFIVNGLTGATKLQLPFVETSKVGAIDIIRRPAPSDSLQLTNSRLYNKAQIRILLADTIKDLHPERGAGVLDANDVQIGAAPSAATFVSYPVSPTGAGITAGPMYFATGKPSTGSWVTPTGCGSPTNWPLHGQVTYSGNLCQATWLRVEYLNNSGTWVGVTQQWLGYGFGRGYDMPPTAPYQTAGIPACPFSTTSTPAYPAGQCYNPISPAILILQQIRGDQTSNAVATGAGTQSDWIPINLYDSREGEPRDSRPAGDLETSCSPNGVMNVVELDVGNLWLWLQGLAPYSGGSGLQVNSSVNNGYILYFSDHRGMMPDTNPMSGVTFYNNISGMSGLNDTVNSLAVTGVPDNTLEPAKYYAYSPEDVAGKEDGILDKWGEANLGAGFSLTGANLTQPYYISGTSPGIANCSTVAEWNMVSGPRHALRLVDGGMSAAAVSYLPHPISPATYGNGFTVGSEEPVYVYGDYNSGSADPFWPSGANPTTPHSAAAIIADAVTLLSNPPSGITAPSTNTGWTDHESFQYPGQAVKVNGPPAFPGRQGNTSYYRMAIAAGKSVPFPDPTWATAAGLKDFGTDGGMHNFLRYLEDRSDNGNGATVNYVGSLISMYYSQYATGIFKCCNSVYGAPTRNYFFDTQFLNPNNLPPGTPMFQDVVSLSYHQTFTPQ